MSKEDLQRRLQQLLTDLKSLVEHDSEQEVQGGALPLMDQLITEARPHLPISVSGRLVDVIGPEMITERESMRAADAIIIIGQVLAALPIENSLSLSETQDATSTISDVVDNQRDGLAAAFDAVEAQNPQGVVSALESWIQDTEDPAEALFRKSISLLLRFRAGDEDAFEELKSRAVAKETRTLNTIRHYAMALQELGEEGAAVAEIDALSQELSTDDRLLLLIFSASLIEATGRAGDARSRLTTVVNSDSITNETKSKALKQLAALDAGTNLTASIAYQEMALALTPLDHQLRFELAYAYGQNGQDDAALFHYLRLKQSGTSTSTSINNLGASLDAIGAPIAGNTEYREAVEAGSALAASNLAFSALTSGDLAGAREWIEKGKALEPEQQRLLLAVSELKKAIDNETEIQKAATSRGRKLQSIMRAGRAGPPAPLPLGEWRFQDILVNFSGSATSVLAESEGSSRKLTILLKSSVPVITVEVTKGHFPTTYRGVGVMAGADLYKLWLRDWETKGVGAIVELRRVSADGVDDGPHAISAP